MNNENMKVCNEKTETPNTPQMNDKDILNVVLELEKNLSNNLSIALNEASNEYLYDELFTIFEDIKDTQRDLFELSFRKGWYTLEKAVDIKINEKINCFNEQLEQLLN